MFTWGFGYKFTNYKFMQSIESQATTIGFHPSGNMCSFNTQLGFL